MSRTLSTFWCKNFSGVFEAASYVSRRALAWEKNFVLQLFLLSSDIQIKHFCLFVGVPRHCWRKAVYVSGSWVWRKPFFCYFSAMNCWYWAKILQHFGVKVLAGFSKQLPTCPEEQWIGENKFYLIFYTIFGQWAKTMGPFGGKIRQGCENCNLGFKKTSPMKFVFCHCSPMNCWKWAENFQLFAVKILAGFSKLHPTCPEEHWRGKKFLSSNCFCYLRTFR